MKNKLFYGVGINDANYQIYNLDHLTGVRVCCPYYTKWASMICRAYSAKYKERSPSYKDVSVCEDWLTFSKFKSWMETQDWEGKELDKDILNPENKIYCPEYCVFISSTINTFVNEQNKNRKRLLGVTICTQKKLIIKARCCNPITRKAEHLGVFKSEIEAHLAWKKRKLEILKMLIENENDERISKALMARYSWPFIAHLFA